MLPIRKYIESGKMSLIYRFLLLIWDAVCINLCSYAALFIRYELKWDKFIKSGMSIDYPHDDSKYTFNVNCIYTFSFV